MAFNGDIFVITNDGLLLKIDAKGSMRWEMDVASGGPVISRLNDDIIMGTRSGGVLRIDPTGTLKWKTQIKEREIVENEPRPIFYSESGIVVVEYTWNQGFVGDNLVAAISPTTGNVRWTRKYGGRNLRVWELNEYQTIFSLFTDDVSAVRMCV